MVRTSLLRMGVALGALASILSPATGLAKEVKVLVAARDRMWNAELSVTRELAVMVDMLEKAGFTPVVASPDGRPFDGGATKVSSDLKFDDVRVSDFAAVVMPCMSNSEGDPIPPALVEIATAAAAAGKPLAAQRSAIYILWKAGLLQGRRYAYAQKEFPGAVYGGDGVVQDGNVITSAICPNEARSTGKPDGTVPLMEAVIKALKAR